MKKRTDTKLLKIEFKPLEPYFFGNDRSLKYAGADAQLKSASYYAVSEKLPLQSTLFGTLRYLGIANKNNDFRLSEQDVQNIGSESYQLTGENQSFGKIIQISNLYLADAEGNAYIRLPKDQKPGETWYHPYGKTAFDEKPVDTNSGEKYLPHLDLKKEHPEGFVRLKDGKVIFDQDIFLENVQTGIDVAKREDTDKSAYFKKKGYFMENYSFMIYAEVERDFPKIQDKFVKMGQGKSSFAVKWQEVEQPDWEETEMKTFCESNEMRSPLPVASRKVILTSDCYVKNLKAFYECCYFAHTGARDYRAFKTVYGANSQRQRYRKESILLKLIKAGSVFLVNESKADTFIALLKNEDANIAGFNHYITGGKEL